MSGNVANIRVVPCRVIWGGVDLGLTDGDLEFKLAEKAVDITAHQEGSNVLDAIRTGKSLSLAVKLQETTVAQLRAAILNGGGDSSGGVAQAQTISCIADTAGSLNSKFFPIVSKLGNKYLVWMNVNAAGVAPSLPGYTNVAVVLATGAVNTAVATAVAAALNALDDFVAAAVGVLVTCTDANAGFVKDGVSAGNSGFTVLVTVPGVSALTGWGGSKDFTSQLADSDQLVLHPTVNADADKSEDLNAWKAYPDLGSIKPSGEHPLMVDVTFKVFPDSSKPVAVRLFGYGDGS